MHGAENIVQTPGPFGAHSRGPGAAQWMPWLRPLSAGERPALERAAAEDRHTVQSPTHLITRGEEIVGYVSLGAIPLMLPWLHSRKVKPRESVYLLNLVENLLAGAGATQLCVPCAAASPFRDYMDALGYANYGDATVHIKTLVKLKG